MLVHGVCAPRVTRCGLGRCWSRDFFRWEAGRMLAGIQACATGFAAVSGPFQSDPGPVKPRHPI